MGRDSKVIRQEGFRWEGVELRLYKPEAGSHRGISRQTILGEARDERDLAAITRYFEIQPGGYSTLERHHHPHTVVIVRGHGQVVLGDRVHEVGHLDCVYVAPDTLHQFHATGGDPLGFLCIVDRERDRPEPASDEEIEALATDPELGRLVRRR